MTSAGARKRKVEGRPSQPCCCFMQYLGPTYGHVNSAENGHKTGNEYDFTVKPTKYPVTILQQHCGGNPIVVFKEDLLPGGKLGLFVRRKAIDIVELVVFQPSSTSFPLDTLATHLA